MPEVVGVDIGTSAVRASELDTATTPPSLKAYGQVGLPPGAIVDGEIQDVTAVSDAIRRLWANGNFKARTVVVGIAGLRAITREIDLPFVPDDEVDSAVRFQSEEVIPFPPDKTLLSAQVLADYQTADNQMMRRVLVAAAHRDLVDGVVAAVEGAGLQVEGVDLVSSAIVRAVADPNSGTDAPEAIVSVGAGLTVVVVHQAGRPQFVRTVGVGGNSATAAISSSLGLPLADAELLKRRLGDPSPQSQSAERAVQGSIGELVSEIRNSVQYFASLPGRAPISRILVTGGGSRLRGLVEQLQSQVKIPVQVVSSLARLDLSQIDLDPEKAVDIDPVLATPIGLALPEPHAGAKKFNLVPPEILERVFQKRVKIYSVVAGVTVVALTIAWGALTYVQNQSAETSVENLNTKIYSDKAEIPKYSKFQELGTRLQSAQREIKAVSSSSPDWYSIITALQSVDPTGLTLTGFTGTTSSSSSSSSPSSAGSSPSCGFANLSVSVAGPLGAASDGGIDQYGAWLDDIPGNVNVPHPANSANSSTYSPMFCVTQANVTGTITLQSGTIQFNSTIGVNSQGSMYSLGNRVSS